MSDLHYQASMVESSYGIGKIEGRLEGKIEGRLEGILEVALKLLDIMDDATIAEKTGLSVTEVGKLRGKS